MLHLRCVPQHSKEDLDEANNLLGVKIKLIVEAQTLYSRGIVEIMRTNSPTSARHGDDLGYIRIWATPSRMLAFNDGTPNLYISQLSVILHIKTP